MLNGIWIFLVVGSLVAAAFSGHMGDVTLASVDWAKKAVTLSLGLIGLMAFWLGMMRVARDAGILRGLAHALRPIMTRLFPNVPAEHPAMAAMIMNISANMLGLANAATPFGIKAMEELDRLNPRKGTATDAMCLFLAINTSNVSLLPLGVMGLRAAAGSADVAGVVPTTLLATTISTLTAIFIAKLLARTVGRRDGAYDVNELSSASDESLTDAAAGSTPGDLTDAETLESEAAAAQVRAGWSKLGLVIRRLVVAAIFASLGVGLVLTLIDPTTFQSTAEATGEIAQKGWAEVVGDLTSAWILPLLIALIALSGWLRGVRVYESLVTGAREGFQVAVRIIPYLVAILVAVGMLQASGALDLVIRAVSPITTPLGLPGEALPMALLRPLSGSGAFGVMAHALETYGPDSYVGYLVSTLQGSTETTFYVLAVYFGSVAVRRTRYALTACLLADFAGIVGAILAVKLFTAF